MYIITRQEDRVDNSGYRTTLQLTRIAGDEDYIKRTKQTIISKVPVVTANYIPGSTYTVPSTTYSYPSGNTYTSTAYDLTKMTEPQVRKEINKGKDIQPVKKPSGKNTNKRGGGFSGGGFGGGDRGGGFSGGGFGGGKRGGGFSGGGISGGSRGGMSQSKNTKNIVKGGTFLGGF